MGSSPFKTIYGMNNGNSASENTPLSGGNRPTQFGPVSSHSEVRRKTDDAELVPRTGVTGVGEGMLPPHPEEVTEADLAIPNDMDLGEERTKEDQFSIAVSRVTGLREGGEEQTWYWRRGIGDDSLPVQDSEEEWEDIPSEAKASLSRAGSAQRMTTRNVRGGPYVRGVELKATEEVKQLLVLHEQVARMMGRLDPDAVSITAASRCGSSAGSVCPATPTMCVGTTGAVPRVVLQRCDGLVSKPVVISSDEDTEGVTGTAGLGPKGGEATGVVANIPEAGSASMDVDSDPVEGVVRRRGATGAGARIVLETEEDDPADALLPSSDDGTDGSGRPGFVPGKRGRKPGVWTDPRRLGPGMKALPTRPDLRNWAETMSVGGLAGQAQRELDAVAAVVSATKHMKTTDMRAIRVAIRRASAVAAELTGRAERGENPDKPAREVVFRQGMWEIKSHKLSTQVRALTSQAHTLGECLHVKERELEFLRGKYARLEARARVRGVDVTEAEAMPFHPSVPLPTRAELLPSCVPPWTEAGARPEATPGPSSAARPSPLPSGSEGNGAAATKKKKRRREPSPPSSAPAAGPPSRDNGAGAPAEQPWDVVLRRMEELERRVDARLLALGRVLSGPASKPAAPPTALAMEWARIGETGAAGGEASAPSRIAKRVAARAAGAGESGSGSASTKGKKKKGGGPGPRLRRGVFRRGPGLVLVRGVADQCLPLSRATVRLPPLRGVGRVFRPSSLARR